MTLSTTKSGKKNDHLFEPASDVMPLAQSRSSVVLPDKQQVEFAGSFKKKAKEVKFQQDSQKKNQYGKQIIAPKTNYKNPYLSLGKKQDQETISAATVEVTEPKIMSKTPERIYV